MSAEERALIRTLRPEAWLPLMVTGGSAALSVAVYAGLWSPTVAFGLVLGMWAHELGHRAVLGRLGIEASPIVFVPFIGAVQRPSVPPATASHGAWMALAGPACGLLFAITCKIAHLLNGDPDLQLLATALAALTVLDLLPFRPLDGHRICAALGRRERIACAAALFTLALATQSPLFVPSCTALTWSATRPASTNGNCAIALAFVLLLAAPFWLI